MLRRRLAVTLVVAATMASAAPGAGAAGTPYTMSFASGVLVLRPPVGGTTIAVTVEQTGTSLRFDPATTGLLPATCSNGGGVTTCTTNIASTGIDVAAEVLDVTLEDLQTGQAKLNGGDEADRFAVRGVTISGQLALITDDGADAVTITGTVGSLTDNATADDADDDWRIEVAGLAGALSTGAGNDRVDAGSTQLALDGQEGNDTLTSGSQLTGGDGDDLLRPRAAGQAVSGGPGHDQVSFDGTGTPLSLQVGASGSVYVDNEPAASIQGVEEVEGGDGADTLSGRDPVGPGDVARDVLRGGAGDDVLRGRGDVDDLDGGIGTDTVTYDELVVGKPVTVDLPAGTGGPAEAVDRITSFERVVATNGDDVLIGTSDAETLMGAEGNDRIEAAGGDDTIDGGTGAAVVVAGSGNDTITTDQVNAFADDVNGGSGDDTITTGAGNDVVRSGTGDDTVDAAAGTDTASFDDRSAFEPVVFSIDAGSGGAPGETDVLLGFENVVGTPADDTLTGTDGPNSLTGGEGNDTLVGRGGSDHLDGGPGRDQIDGGSASDTLLGSDHEDRLLAFDGFVDTVDCGAAEDDAEYDGVDRLASCEFARRLDVTSVGDTDADGVSDPFDCDPRNAGIRPGARDVPGNGVDEDCTGADQALPRVESPIRTSFGVRRSGTAIGRLTPVELPSGASVRVTCTTTVRFRGRCPFASRVRRPRGRSRSVALAPLFRKRRLPIGTRVEIQITAPGHIGKVVRLTVRRTALPRAQELCLQPGAKRPAGCPSADGER